MKPPRPREPTTSRSASSLAFTSASPAVPSIAAWRSGTPAASAGTALAARTERASLRQVGFFTNPLLLWGIASEVVFLAALVLVPPLQPVFGTRTLGLQELALLCAFPVVVWGADELRRARLRRRERRPAGEDPIRVFPDARERPRHEDRLASSTERN